MFHSNIDSKVNGKQLAYVENALMENEFSSKSIAEQKGSAGSSTNCFLTMVLCSVISTLTAFKFNMFSISLCGSWFLEYGVKIPGDY